MKIEIIGAESLGVRGLCCFITVKEQKILIDPGIALGFIRKGLLPHPAQVAVAEVIREKIIHAWKLATDIVFSHFHGDHVPLTDANPYQLDIKRVVNLNPGVRIWSKSAQFLSSKEQKRATALKEVLDVPWEEGKPGTGAFSFSLPVPHGENIERNDRVMMTRIENDTVFVHTSDIQLLDDDTVDRVLEWQPDIVLADGPPIYFDKMNTELRHRAWNNAVRLAGSVDTLVLDHHLMRSHEGVQWLEGISAESGGRVICAADFMESPRRLLEAERESLYDKMPVPPGWHRDYGEDRAGTGAFKIFL
ncbi:Predicted hydrolase of the metallo-beta-lactamase superfamily [Desulfocicer vacuolatum DSM 3385]|uniref:Predicted hydrolase of the metallo-beta-lactamase superfamily n=1 Tax=Desulfocicer vacuolatum DSM 3385 TaxID=1121400 RepID=A0A1W2AKW7_9BACT|nr:hypothetical protein [Desulfocicer vacuolatum]SMC61326.1 Predicted hydrolase of the metallo-beta-lactamase superfamily [Desulfocicer vacuolatum DSM 3385]